MGPAVPNATSRVIIIAPMMKELVEALGYRPQLKAAAGIAMAVLIGFGQMGAVFLTSSTTGRAGVGGAAGGGATRPELDHLGALRRAGQHHPVRRDARVPALALSAGAGDRRLTGERAPCSHCNRRCSARCRVDEKIALGVGIGLLLGFITQPLHDVDPAWVAVLAAGVLAATRVVTVDTLRAVNWNFALLFGVLISLATVFKHTELDRWMADRIAAARRRSDGDAGRVRCWCWRCFALPSASWCGGRPRPRSSPSRWRRSRARPACIPFVVGLVALIAGNGFFLPYQSTSYLALYAGTGGQLFAHRQALPAAFAYALLGHCRGRAQRAGLALDGLALIGDSMTAQRSRALPLPVGERVGVRGSNPPSLPTVIGSNTKFDTRCHPKKNRPKAGRSVLVKS